MPDPTLNEPPRARMSPLQKPDRLEAARIEKLDKLVALGHDPYGGRFDGHEAIGVVSGPRCPEPSGTPGESVRVAVRIMSRRKAGKLRFFDVADASGSIQILCSRGELGEEQWELLGQFDLGDLIGVDGRLWRTDSGEVSIFADKLHILCKALAQPPEKYHGVHDVETLLRHRSLDLIYTPGVRDRMLLRTKILDSIRRTLGARDFVEVETPVFARRRRRGRGAAVRHAPQRPGHRPVLANRPRTAHLKRLMVGGHRAGLRDRPRLPQRGHRRDPQPRIHDDGGLPGVR